MMVVIFYGFIAAVLACSLLTAGNMNFTEQIVAAVAAVLTACSIFVFKSGGAGAANRVAVLGSLGGIAFLAARPLIGPEYWWQNVTTAGIVASLAGLGILSIIMALRAEPHTRDEATDNFLMNILTGTAIAAIAASAVTTMASGNTALSLHPIFITIFGIGLLGAAWYRFAGKISPKGANILRIGTAAVLAAAFGTGIVSHKMAEEAFVAGKEAAGKDNEEAKKNFREIAEGSADQGLRSKARLELARIALAEGNIGNAADEIEKSEDFSGKDALALREEIAMKILDKASQPAKGGKTGETADAAQRAAKIAPFSAKVFAGCGKAMLEIGKCAEALRFADEALRKNQGLGEAWDVKLKSYLAEGRDEEAARTLEKYPSGQLPDDSARIRMGRMLVFLGNGSRAKAALLKFEQSDSAEALYWLGRASELLGDEAEAVSFYTKASGDKKFADAFYRMGAMSEAAGKKKEAQELYETTLKALPEHYGAARGKAGISGEKDPYAEYSRIEGLVVPGTPAIYARFSPREAAAMEPVKLTFNFIFVETGIGGNLSLSGELEGPLYNDIYTYTVSLTSVSMTGLAVGEGKTIVKEISIPGLPPGEWIAKLVTASEARAKIGGIKAEMRADYAIKSIPGIDMLGSFKGKKYLLFSKHKNYFLLTSSSIPVIFVLAANKGGNVLRLTVSGDMVKNELPRILVLHGGKSIYRGFIKSSEKHIIDIPFESNGGCEWFSVEFLNDYYSKSLDGKVQDRNFVVYEASITDR